MECIIACYETIGRKGYVIKNIIIDYGATSDAAFSRSPYSDFLTDDDTFTKVSELLQVEESILHAALLSNCV